MENLYTEIRNIFGKKLKKLRKEGKLPAVLYGKKRETAALFVDLKSFNKVWKEAGESSIVKIKDPNKDNSFLDVMIQDVDIDPVKNELIHADFYEVEMDKPIITEIPLVFEGTAPAVKELSGVLVKAMRELEVEALPKDLPRELKVDISKLKDFEAQVLVKDIKLPKGVSVNAKEDEVIVFVEQPKEEIAEEKEMKIEDVEVEKKGKKEEENLEGEEKKEK